MARVILPSAVCLTIMGIGVVKSFLAGVLLYKECKKRRSGETLFASKDRPTFSIICILCPLTVGLNETNLHGLFHSVGLWWIMKYFQYA